MGRTRLSDLFCLSSTPLRSNRYRGRLIVQASSSSPDRLQTGSSWITTSSIDLVVEVPVAVHVGFQDLASEDLVLHNLTQKSSGPESRPKSFGAIMRCDATSCHQWRRLVCQSPVPLRRHAPPRCRVANSTMRQSRFETLPVSARKAPTETHLCTARHEATATLAARNSSLILAQLRWPWVHWRRQNSHHRDHDDAHQRVLDLMEVRGSSNSSK